MAVSVAVVAASMALVLGVSAAPQEPKADLAAVAPKKVPTPNVGRQARPGNEAEAWDPETPAGTEKPYLSQLIASKKANDAVGIKRLGDMRRGYLLPSGTRLLVIQAHLKKVDMTPTTSEAFARELQAGALREPGLETVEVRVVDGPCKDLALYVPVDSIALMRFPVPNPDEVARKRRDAEKAARKAANEEARAKADAPGAKAARLLALARNLEKSGKSKPALEDYKKVVADFPGTPAAKEAATRVKVLEGK